MSCFLLNIATELSLTKFVALVMMAANFLGENTQQIFSFQVSNQDDEQISSLLCRFSHRIDT